MVYGNCYTPDCPKRETCALWINALAEIEQKARLLSFTNPALIEEAGGFENCPNYHEHKLRRFARGLAWQYDDLTLAQWKKVKADLSAHFGYSYVVKMRCGYEAISPEEQAEIAQIFDNVAPGHAPHYTTFEEHYFKPPRVEGKEAKKLLYGPKR